jgi:hypothetical protein
MQRSLSDAANYVLEQFDLFGIQIPEDSRIKSMYNSVCNEDGSSRGFISENNPDFNVAREALRDFSQLEFFFDQITNDSKKSNYSSILKQIAKDSVLPQDDKQESRGRDAQAEVFVFAVCKKAGMNPLFEEPDFTCYVEDKKYGIAVKRIKNLSKIKTRLCEGARQIQDSGLSGIISVEVTIAVNSKNYNIVTKKDEQKLKEWWTKKMEKTVNRELKDFQSEQVRGIFLHEHCPVCFEGCYELRTMNYGISTAKSSAGKDEWRKFKAVFLSGLPNLVM